MFESNAIASYVANDALRGIARRDAAYVLQWMEFADEDITPAAFTWVFPCMGLVHYNKQVSLNTYFSFSVMQQFSKVPFLEDFILDFHEQSISVDLV